MKIGHGEEQDCGTSTRKRECSRPSQGEVAGNTSSWPEKFRTEPCRMCGTPHVHVTAAWCRAVRLAAGLRLKDVAQRAGVHFSTLCDVERGKLRCTPRIRRAYEHVAKEQAA